MSRRAQSAFCRGGVHRWQQLRKPSGQWYRQCRRCGATAEIGEGGLGIAVAFVGAVALVCGGVAITVTAHTLIGSLMIIGGVLGLGWVAFVVWLDRLAVFLSTGRWRRRS